jgi:hypothetical protein
MLFEGLQYGAFGYTAQDTVWFTRPRTAPLCRSVDGTNYYPYNYPCFRTTLPER